jgi:hypothetical protein
MFHTLAVKTAFNVDSQRISAFEEASDKGRYRGQGNVDKAVAGIAALSGQPQDQREMH